MDAPMDGPSTPTAHGHGRHRSSPPPTPPTHHSVCDRGRLLRGAMKSEREIGVDGRARWGEERRISEG